MSLHPLHWQTLPAHQIAEHGKWTRRTALVLTLLACAAAGLVLGIFLGLVTP